ncbi:serine/threonine-protein kinase [Micromonospora sp. NPDC000018]|uniref:serine/threonine-protein kinase n=1 Tax=Micromonospora sp. NPDC000018 TaxID=3154239 RepID=UPI003329DF29
MLADMCLKDRYILSRYPLAHNGMGEVWTARDTALDRDVIVKFVNATALDVDLLRRFRREALLTVRLDHPGVPAVYDLDQHDGRPYVVLQKIDGITLSDLIAEHDPIPIGWVAAIGAQISSVLISARQVGLVHRDIKPSNIMLDASGAVKVLDFGLAVIRADDRYSRITQSGQSLGTVGYMAPEQILGEPTDHRTDLYGLGATLFDLLTAHTPFDGDTTMTTLRHQLDDPPPRPGSLRPEIPTALDDLVHSLLAFRPQDRPTDASEVYAALAPLAQDRAPLPGVVTDRVGAVQKYAAIVGRVPQPTHHTVTPPQARHVDLDVEQAARQAEQSFAAGNFRAAARTWRRLADYHAQRHGDDHPLVFDLRLRAARAHMPLGEHDRALRQLNALLRDRIRTDGPEHPAVLDLRQEIEDLSKEHAAHQPPRYVPNADR